MRRITRGERQRRDAEADRKRREWLKSEQREYWLRKLKYDAETNMGERHMMYGNTSE